MCGKNRLYKRRNVAVLLFYRRKHVASSRSLAVLTIIGRDHVAADVPMGQILKANNAACMEAKSRFANLRDVQSLADLRLVHIGRHVRVVEARHRRAIAAASFSGIKLKNSACGR